MFPLVNILKNPVFPKAASTILHRHFPFDVSSGVADAGTPKLSIGSLKQCVWAAFISQYPFSYEENLLYFRMDELKQNPI